jgi:large repetitive protein
MKKRKTTHSRKLGFQQLENRMLMAGNVAVSVSHHSLVITGDKQDNDIQLAQVASGEYTVTGIQTTVNGNSSPQTFSGISGNVNINMNAGNDAVSIGSFAQAISLPGNLKINLGSGSDKLSVANATIVGGLSITGNTTAKKVELALVNIGEANFNSGKNDCVIDLPNGSNISVDSRTNIERDLTIKGTGAGSGDSITLDGITVHRDVSITTSKNQGDNIDVDLISVGGNFSIDGDNPGSEVITMNKATISGDMSLETGSGDDAVVVTSSSVGKNATIQTGAGDDLVRLGEGITSFGLEPAFFDAGQISVNLGKGDDVLRLGETETTHGGSYAGGKGDDGVFIDFNQTGGTSLSGFEQQGA